MYIVDAICRSYCDLIGLGLKPKRLYLGREDELSLDSWFIENKSTILKIEDVEGIKKKIYMGLEIIPVNKSNYFKIEGDID